jgi:serine protease Do
MAASLTCAFAEIARTLRASTVRVHDERGRGHGAVVTTGLVQRCNSRWVVADVRLAPGNSGGPLADAWGRIIGINAMVARGLALAIPSDAATAFARAA